MKTIPIPAVDQLPRGADSRLTRRRAAMYADCMKGARSEAWWENEEFTPLDRALSSFHRFFIEDRPIASVAVSIAAYAAVVLAGGSRLGISSNYFVLLPVFAVSLAFGLPGGLVAGTLALPANLALFILLGHSEFSPASKAIAEMSGIFVGTSFGYLADYFRKLNREIERRTEAENRLREETEEKDILLRELHHRVKNNLNVITSMIQLQRNRSSDPAFREASGLLLNRVYAVSLAHDTLFGGERLLSGAGTESVDCAAYLRRVAENAALVYPDVGMGVSVTVDPPDARLEKSVALNLGIIVNELAVNAAKHAFAGISSPGLAIALNAGPTEWALMVEDNGVGMAEDAKGGLGRTLIDSIAARLDGRTCWRSDGGLRFKLAFPLKHQKALSDEFRE